MIMMKYENVEQLNRQGIIFVIIHTLVIINLAIDFNVFM